MTWPEYKSFMLATFLASVSLFKIFVTASSKYSFFSSTTNNFL